MNTIIYAAEKRKGVGSIDLQMTYNTNVITDVRKANIRLLHNNSKTKVWFLRASHLSPNKLYMTLTTCTSNQFVGFASHSQSLQDDF